MRLQGALHGMSKADRTRRGDELIERVGLADAADRKVGGYSGGMKRRLDLALALLHGPRVLFLDEPTTGLDIQSRSALWDEVAHLSRDEGMTVFLTTQYLEEADQLADHLGIIDHGKIVAEGTPATLKAEVGRPTVEVGPDRRTPTASAPWSCSRRFGELVPGTPQGAAVGSKDGGEELANIVRAFDAGRRQGREPRAARARASTTSSSPRPAARSRGRRREAAGAGRDRRAARPRGSAGLMEAAAVPRSHRRTAEAVDLDAGAGARAPLDHADDAPAGGDHPRHPLPADPAGDQLGRAEVGDLASPGFPTDSYVTFALAFAFIQAGVFAVIGTGQNLAEDNQDGFFNRLQLTPIHPAALVAGQLAGTLTLGLFQAATYISVGLLAGRAHRRPASAARSC